MNNIEALIQKGHSEGSTGHINFKIDDIWLDQELDTHFTNSAYHGLIPTLSFWLETEEEKQIVWNRILPDVGETLICPVLMCPDDCDFSCTLIVAEIVNTGEQILWTRLGLNRTEDAAPDKVATKVEWFKGYKSFKFEMENYLQMLNDFKYHYELDRIKHEQRLKGNI
ncbi:MAG: hypothetical protein IT236_01795 [Bacteroidia bacterium]|nr:hypothetical protein [Bacteroidia bacterium]